MTHQELQALYHLLYEQQTEIIQLREQVEQMRVYTQEMEAVQAVEDES